MIEQLIDFIRSLTDADKLAYLLSHVMTGWVGYAVLFAIVFAESGLLVGFFLPGDSLLFTIGVVAGVGQLDIGLMIVLLSIASIAGDGIGFLLGRTIGPSVFARKNSRIFRREYLEKTQAFYERHGGKTIIYAKFVPIIRTFAAFIAGVANMNYTRFVVFNIVGAVGWVSSMITLGYVLGGIPIIKEHFEKIVILIIVVSVAPILLQVLRHRRTPVA